MGGSEVSGMGVDKEETQESVRIEEVEGDEKAGSR
jgi:hypothetical protein